MNTLTRRDLLKRTALGTAALGLSAVSCATRRVPSHRAGANETIRVAQVGFHSQGNGHIGTLNRIPGVRVVALCDVDRQVLARKAQELGNVETYTDIRALLENKDVDAISIATPNHWHALATVWACQAGKDVYVEKPVSHNVFEGRQMVEAARKYKRIVQAGTQCRSSAGLQQAVEYVRSGQLGKLVAARGFCYKARKSIGLADGPQRVPENIDYDLWCGPAPADPPRRNGGSGPVHYDWHWFWNYGNGDFGNQGPHQVDICRWFLGEDAIAPFSMAIGGRLGYRDSAETPNTMIIYHGYKVPMIFEVRGLPASKAAQEKGWAMDRYRGVAIGNVIECTGGYVVVPSYTEAIVHALDGRVIERFDGRSKKGTAEEVKTPTGLSADSGGHHGNWIKAVRSRKRDDLNSEVLDGHLSAGLVHTGNISYRLGARQSPAQIRDALRGTPELREAFERMAAHLDANGVDISSDKLQLGAPLKFDPRREKFAGNAEANRMLTRDYREPFVVRAKV